MNSDAINTISVVYVIIAAIVSIEASFQLEQRLKARTPATRPYKWGFFTGCMGVSCAPFAFLSIIGLTNTWTKGDLDVFAVLLATGVWSVISAISGWFVIRRKRWAWVVATIFSFNIVVWIINYIYGRNRWGEFIGEPYCSAGTEDEGYELLQDATRLETQGRIQEALALYQSIANKYSHGGAGKDAQKSIEDLQARTGAKVQPVSHAEIRKPSIDNPTQYMVKQPDETEEFSYVATLEEIKTDLKSGRITPEWGVKKESGSHWITVQELIYGKPVHKPVEPEYKAAVKTKILIAALAVFILTCLFPPWQHTYRYGTSEPAGYSLIFIPPSGGGSLQVDFGRLFIEWAALAAITGIVWLFVVQPSWTRDDKSNRPQKFTLPPGNPQN